SMLRASATTCWLVRMYPAGSTSTPEPIPVCVPRPRRESDRPAACSVTIWTTAGRTFSATSRTVSWPSAGRLTVRAVVLGAGGRAPGRTDNWRATDRRRPWPWRRINLAVARAAVHAPGRSAHRAHVVGELDAVARGHGAHPFVVGWSGRGRQHGRGRRLAQLP